MNLGERLQHFCELKGYTRESLARALRTNPVTVLRWERGTSKPSHQLASRLQALGFGDLAPQDTKLSSTPRVHLNGHAVHFEQLSKFELHIGDSPQKFVPSPYVVNGPPDQLPLFERLYDLQSTTTRVIPATELAQRLAAVAFVPGLNTRPAQFELENPSAKAGHWNTNYGPHNFHRYVGRFPPHLVRALLNNFGLTSQSVVCDPFCGSGTTLLEARMLGIRSIGIEVCPLSCLISRAKSQFPTDVAGLECLSERYARFYKARWSGFTRDRRVDDISYDEILGRDGNPIPRFPNIEKWMCPSALLGTSITVEFIKTLDGYEQDFLSCALSARMRSIGNLDVDVVRAEYSKVPRSCVDVAALVTKAVHKMVSAIAKAIRSHRGLIGPQNLASVYEEDLLSARIDPGTIDAIITSPPYGVEALSYLRTHLLSYRSLYPILGHDPYTAHVNIIGSEYLDRTSTFDQSWEVADVSPRFRDFFSKSNSEICGPNLTQRTLMMAKFFDQMLQVARVFYAWLRPGGNVAFVIGNKKLGTATIPTDLIVDDVFRASGFRSTAPLKHKLKCSNTNSEVPWQERTIQEEFVLFFQK